MLKHWGQKLSKGFCSGQMLPLITAEWPLKKKPENIVNVDGGQPDIPVRDF